MQAIIMIAIIVCIKCHDEELAVQTETENHYIGEYVVDCVYIFTWRRKGTYRLQEQNYYVYIVDLRSDTF